jgi:molybdenum cofactor cytidylyltransferase
MTQQIVGVLLAAGASARFAGNKLLQPLDDGTAVVVAAARQLVTAVPGSVAVVRCGDDSLSGLLAEEGLFVLGNPRADRGLGASIACGVAATRDAGGWLIALADMPFISAHTMRAVAQALTAGAAIAAPVYRGQRGHPVGFAQQFGAPLVELDGDQGARRLLESHPDRVTLIEVDDASVLRDIDTRDDL